jgi:hypothetical protein
VKFRLLKRLICAGAMATTVAMVAGGGVGQAATTNQSPTFFTTQVQQFRAAGSETLFYIMDEVQTLWMQTSVYGCTLQSSDLRTCNTGADGTATDTQDNYSRNEFINGLGNGSGNGIGQMCGTKQTGGLTVDFARASRAWKTSDGCASVGVTQFNIANDGVVGIDFPFNNTTTLTCLSGDTCSATQVGPVAAGWRTSDPVAGPYTGTPVTNIDNSVTDVSLGGKSLAFRIYCDKGGRTTNADLVANTTTSKADRVVSDASAAASGATTLTSAGNNFQTTPSTFPSTPSGDIGAEVSGTGIPANDYVTAVGSGGSSVTLAVATTGAVSGVTLHFAATVFSPQDGNGVGEFAAGDLNQTVNGAGAYGGIPASTTVFAFVNTGVVILSNDVTAASTTAQVALGGSGFAINDWGQLTDPAHPITGTVTTLGTSIGAPIYIPAINTGSGTYSTWSGFVGCDPNTKNTDHQVVQENDAPQLADVAGLGKAVAQSDHPTDNIAAANQMAETLYYMSYGVSQWHPYTYTSMNDVEVGGVPTPQVQSGSIMSFNGTGDSVLGNKSGSFPGARHLYLIVRNDQIRGSVAGFINWICNPSTASHGTDLTTGKNYAQELAGQFNTIFSFPQIQCASDTAPAINAPGATTNTFNGTVNPQVTSLLLDK